MALRNPGTRHMSLRVPPAGGRGIAQDTGAAGADDLQAHGGGLVLCCAAQTCGIIVDSKVVVAVVVDAVAAGVHSHRDISVTFG